VFGDLKNGLLFNSPFSYVVWHNFLAIVQISTNRKHNVSETGSVSKMLSFLFVEIRMMDKVQKLSSNECYIPSSEPFRMYNVLG
jgi:hypothetical protein